MFKNKCKKIGFIIVAAGMLFVTAVSEPTRVSAEETISDNSVAENTKSADAVSEDTISADTGSELSGNYFYNGTGGKTSNNIGGHTYQYDRWATPTTSYLLADSDGGYTRLEAIDSLVYLEKYSSTFQLQSSKTLAMELPQFGGAFWGNDYNFLVFGQANPSESDNTEVMRVVKYDKSWNRISSKSVYGANTQEAFAAGKVSMAEADGMLYIHTCHKMYKSSDGANHQANMTYKLNQDSMEIEDSWYGVMNIGWGYVSHSFNQFVETDGTSLYRLDHGDAYPRSVVITKCSVDSITHCTNKDVLLISGNTGNNDTGVAIGGFTLNSSRLVTVGNSVDQTVSPWNANGQRNIFVSSVNTDLEDEKTVWITNYASDAGIKVGNPHLIETGSSQMYILWEETKDSRTVVKAAKINGDGSLVEGIYTINARLSGCVPVYSAGKITWYVTQNSVPVFYHLDTNALAGYDVIYGLENCNIHMENTAFEFGAVRYKPEVQLSYGGYIMQENVDYTLSYSNNYYPGTATITITGKGIFSGTVTKNFTISPIDISGYRLELEPAEMVYNGEFQKPAGYSIYKGNEKMAIAGSILYRYGTGANSYTCTFTANESFGYKGTLYATFTIRPRDLSGGHITLETTSYTYDGKEKKPTVTVTLDGKALINGSNYTVAYSNNINAGTGKVTVTGEGNYTGSVTATFTIKAVSKPEESSDKKPEESTKKAPRKGTVLSDESKKANYKIVQSASSGGMVQYVAPVKKEKIVSIPATVKINGVSYKVTSIAPNAFKNNKTIKKVTIGNNIKTIGAKAFYGCKNLKTIVIKTKQLTSKNVGSKAFKGIYSKATLKVPKNKKSSYKQLLRKKGVSAKAKFENL